MNRCQRNWRYWNSGRGEHCNEPARSDCLVRMIPETVGRIE